LRAHLGVLCVVVSGCMGPTHGQRHRQAVATAWKWQASAWRAALAHRGKNMCELGPFRDEHVWACHATMNSFRKNLSTVGGSTLRVAGVGRSSRHGTHAGALQTKNPAASGCWAGHAKFGFHSTRCSSARTKQSRRTMPGANNHTRHSATAGGRAVDKS
jgi:hypothetical protein